jgi:hypothetical protein
MANNIGRPVFLLCVPSQGAVRALGRDCGWDLPIPHLALLAAPRPKRRGDGENTL